jgi:hypothetical protein
MRLFCGRRLERGGAGGLGRRRWAALAVAASPAERRRFLDNAQRLELQQDLEKSRRWLTGSGYQWNVELGERDQKLSWFSMILLEVY